MLRDSYENRIRAWILARPILKVLLTPINRVRQMIIARRASVSGDTLYVNFQNMLVEDPVLRVDEFGGEFEASVRSDVFRRLVMLGEYEPEIVKICSRFLAPSRDVVDVGANIGFYSVFFATRLQKGRVLAVEPTNGARRRLQNNLERNGVVERVIVFGGVLSDRVGDMPISIIPGKEEYSTIGAMCHPATLGEKVETTRVCGSTLDYLVGQHSLDVGFIKMDVEGMEHMVLKGAGQVLEEHRPIIVSELSNPLLARNGSSAEEVVSYIAGKGYVVIDPEMPSVRAGTREYCDILCIPNERAKELVHAGLVKSA